MSPALLSVVAAPGPDTPVERVPRIGSRQAPGLARLGIHTVRDLLLHLPRRHADTSRVLSLADLRPGPDVQTVHAQVQRVSQRRSPRKGMALVEAVLADEASTARAVWFNQPFLARTIHAGDDLVLSGKVRLDARGFSLQNPKFERVVAGNAMKHVGRLTAVYPETGGVTSKFLRERILELLPVADELPDPVPPSVRATEELLGLSEALHRLHDPASLESVERARERMAFEELFLLALAAQRARRRRLSAQGVTIPYDVEAARAFAASLPFTLTTAQRQAAHMILTDMAGSGPMNRLLQGDVGSGKTVVAGMAALVAARAGYQTLVMAPTEILARQHHATLEALLAPHDVAVRLLVGSTPVRARREILAGVGGGQDALLVGTHALIEDDVIAQSLGLVVVDEQHRFGVAQRQRLRLKSALMPNFLAMTATPIPRSLALTAYGDVDLTEIREMPPGRKPVETRVVEPHQRDEAYAFIRTQVQQGRQGFVICPLIEESDKLGVRSATAEYERLRTEVFSDLRLELLHGRMPAREKEERMARFAGGDADLLVATSVVEVGVDIPNATIMLIEGAERFGIAQLHQFRGRIGRGEHAATCLLFQGSPDETGAGRLAAVASTQSGFVLAELDLKLRGAGDMAGLRQHGLPEMRAADLLDLVMQERTRKAAEAWLDHDPELVEYAPLAAAMNGYRAVFDLD